MTSAKVVLFNNSGSGPQEAGSAETEREKEREVVAVKGVVFNNSAAGVWSGSDAAGGCRATKKDHREKEKSSQ